MNEEVVEEQVADMAEKFGEELPIDPLPEDAHEKRDPFSEAVEMMGGDPVESPS